ncbi:hypothetical protein [Pusillimonas sp. ANT_WB101]|uniref:hypothetical protein n=1 Tax=Pusillimonas sp. ANT_WB101 TaxID=2597356 RepID=UPI0011ED923B|nr:hypothetical protein [Pusillimonas sp. ANT_WB101]KAA0910688.1 hypothetical protein FQ179_02085 [Pusillimonas sp. ANT_WB101]
MIETDLYYPAGLPGPLRAGHTASRVSPFARTNMQSGRARQRRTFTSVPSIDTYNFIFTENQAAAFEKWFEESIKDGTEWFNIQRRTPLGLTMLVCRFVDMYQGPNLFAINRWRISAELEAYERPLMPDGWGDLPGFLIEADLFDIAMNREWPEA